MRTLAADRGDAGRRLDLVLRRHLANVPGMTRTRVQEWIEAGNVSINGTPVCRVATRTSAGDVLTIEGLGARDWGLQERGLRLGGSGPRPLQPEPGAWSPSRFCSKTNTCWP